MTLRISAQAKGRKWKGQAFRLIACVGLWAAFGGWKHPTALVLVALAFGAVMVTLTGVVERLHWNDVDIAPDSLTLTRRERSTVLRREDILILELRPKVILLKWRGEAKAHVATLTRERYSLEDWDRLQTNLQPWAKAPERAPD